MYKQRLVTFFELEAAEEFARKVNAKVIPRLGVFDGEFYEWYEVWYVYYDDPRIHETWKDYLEFILLIIVVISIALIVAYVLGNII